MVSWFEGFRNSMFYALTCNFVNLNFGLEFLPLLASWSNGNAFVFGAGGRSFSIESVKSDTMLPMARHLCKGAVLPAGAMTRRWELQTRYTLWLNTANV